MSGTQYNEARRAGGVLAAANRKLNDAKHAPHSSDNERKLKDAEREQAKAQSDFDKKYSAYADSMRGQSGIKDQRHFIN